MIFGIWCQRRDGTANGLWYKVGNSILTFGHLDDNVKIKDKVSFLRKAFGNTWTYEVREYTS